MKSDQKCAISFSKDEVNSLKAKTRVLKSSYEKNGVKLRNLTGTFRSENKFENCFNCLMGQLKYTAYVFSNFNRLHSEEKFVKTNNITLNSLAEEIVKKGYWKSIVGMVGFKIHFQSNKQA